MKYRVVQEGEWLEVSEKVACCDCGLVHDQYFRRRKGKLEVCVFRNNRSTGQVRRHMRRKKNGAVVYAGGQKAMKNKELIREAEAIYQEINSLLYIGIL